MTTDRITAIRAKERLAWADVLELRKRVAIAQEKADDAWKKWARLSYELEREQQQ